MLARAQSDFAVVQADMQAGQRTAAIGGLIPLGDTLQQLTDLQRAILILHRLRRRSSW